MPTSYTPSGIAYDREGPQDRLPVVLVHAGIADRRMWQPQWRALTAERDTVRLDLRGFGESRQPPPEALSPMDDLADTLTELDITRCHLVGASYGAGVAVELALTRPAQVESLFLSAPGGALITEATPHLQKFFEAERSALAADDPDAAVEANLRWWVDGPYRAEDAVPQDVRRQVAAMQRRAFEISGSWGEVPERELDPPAADRLAEVAARTLVLAGALDLDAIADTAARICDRIPDVRRVDWPDTAHLPSMERPADFIALLRDWLQP